MKKIIYTSFNTWKKLENKDNYYFLAISFTIPKYYIGLRYLKLTNCIFVKLGQLLKE